MFIAYIITEQNSSLLKVSILEWKWDW